MVLVSKLSEELREEASELAMTAYGRTKEQLVEKKKAQLKKGKPLESGWTVVSA